MVRVNYWLISCFLVSSAWGGQRALDFSKFILNQSPIPGFRSVVSGQGTPGTWQTVLDEVPSTNAIATNGLAPPTKRAVLAQVARDQTDEHFPLLICEDGVYGDFRLTTRFKTVDGTRERMAGIAFRVQDAKNYYVVRASSLGNTLRFYKFVNGERTEPIGPDVSIPSGVWHELTVECTGFRIRCVLDGKELIYGSDPDRSFPTGKIGFWTKSDSVSYFTDTRIEFAEKDSIAPNLVRDQIRKYPRLRDLRIYVRTNDIAPAYVIASSNPKEMGLMGGHVEKDVLDFNHLYCGIGRDTATVTLPLHDRNGEAIAAVRLVIKSFFGQTEKNALARTMPIVKEMELRVGSRDDLVP